MFHIFWIHGFPCTDLFDVFAVFVYVFGWVWFFCSIFTFFVRGVHFPFARVFQFAVAAFRAQVVEAVKRQHTDSVHPRSIFHIFLDPRLSVAPLAHFFFLFDVFDGLCWFLMVFHVFNMFFIFSIFFPSAFPELSLYKMENMGRTLGAATTKWKTWVEPCVDPLQNHKHG